MYKLPEYNPLEPSEDFVRWILSINRSWRDRIIYEPFEGYVNQCNEWLAEKGRVEYYEEGTEQYNHAIKQERERFKVNSLYYMEKYNWFKYAKAEGGKLKTITCDSQKVICFLIDLGASQAIAKARGIRSTSTYLPVLGLKAKCFKNLHGKYICSDKTKSEQLFSDYIKFSAQEDPHWMQPNICGDSKTHYEYGLKMDKGEKQGLCSKISISAPSKDVINAANPDIDMIDEAPSIPIFDIMLQEARPALFVSDPVTNKRKMSKQIIAWGSSQVDESETQTSDAFEQWWKSLYEQWLKGNYEEGIVPLFFDCFAIPGMTESEYEREKRVAESKNKEAAIIRFRKHYPTCPEDVFLKNVDTLIPFEDIQAQLEKIYLCIKKQSIVIQRGYFEPVYDKKDPLPPEIGSPFRIINANFVPLPDGREKDATVTIFMPPEYNWMNRYFQGTDPIVGQSGHSKFASAIWDKKLNTLSAVVNCRYSTYKKSYEQAYLLHLYYSDINNRRHIPELIEINVGNEYNTYCEVMRTGLNMTARLELPEYLQTGDHIIGVRKTSDNKDRILNKTQELMELYGGRIYIEDFWLQAKSYVRHPNKKGYKDSFAPSDKFSFDDILDAGTYAYINSLCCSQSPRDLGEQAQSNRPKRRAVFKDGHLQYEIIRKR